MSQPAAGQAAPPAQAEGAQGAFGGIVKSLVMFMGMQMAMKYGMSYLGLGPKPTVTGPSSPKPAGTPGADGTVSAPANSTWLDKVEPAWELGTPLSMLLYTSTAPAASAVHSEEPVVVWDGLTYGGWDEIRETDVLLDVPESVRAQNGSWYLDILLVKGGGTDVQDKKAGDIAVYRKRESAQRMWKLTPELTRFAQKKRVRKEKKLIGGDAKEQEQVEEEPEEEVTEQPVVAHYTSNLTLTIVSNGGPVNFAGLPPQIQEHYQLVPGTEDKKEYFPPVFPNDFWLLKEDLYPINETSTQLPLHVNYHALGNLKFQIFAAMSQMFEQASQSGSGGGEMDEVKRMFIETSPWLLITTAIVTLLHTLFEFLAFSSDIGHWRKKDKDLVGVSLNTILTNCFVQLVILLYLHDSSAETSFMILAGQGIGLVIEAWKITKVVDIRIRQAPGTLLGYSITFEDKKELSEDEKKTQEYDRLAFRIVSYFAIPALLAYSVYSLMYETHRGWYSFIVTTLAQAIYMFGFVQLVPQLIINYKLKSVAHMPMKAMMYKTLSTVVDDFFAFCIRMPWLHRLACFRDDVVFVILLYQRWIYRVDYSRVNEYGQVLEGVAEPVGEKDEAAVHGETKKTK